MGRGLLLLGVGLLLQLTSAKVGREGRTSLVSQNNLHGEQVGRLERRAKGKGDQHGYKKETEEGGKTD